MDPDTAPFGRWNRAGLLMLKGGARQDREPPNGAVPSQNLRVLARSAGKFDRPVGEGKLRASSSAVARILDRFSAVCPHSNAAVRTVIGLMPSKKSSGAGKRHTGDASASVTWSKPAAAEGVAAFLDVAETKGRGRVAVLHPCCRTAPLRT